MRALLDVNVLVALLDGSHVHHRATLGWLGKQVGQGWSSCPLTQNGCVRVMSQASYVARVSPKVVAERLGRATHDASHSFWPDSLSLLDGDLVNWNHVLTPRQITDAYLLALAVHHEGRLVTFDRGIGIAAVAGAQPRHLVTLGRTAP